MSKKRVDRKPANVERGLRLGERPPFISQQQHYFIQAILVIVGIAFMRYINYQKTPINPALLSQLAKVNYSSHFNKNSYGSFRPQAYFSLKKRRPDSPIFGIAWYSHAGSNLLSEFSLKCSDDGVTYMWLSADGQTFGVQNIVDGPLNITTQWFNRDSSFAAEFSVKRKDQGMTGLIIYMISQNASTKFTVEDKPEMPRLWVHTPGEHDVSLDVDVSSQKKVHASHLGLTVKPIPDPTKLMDYVRRNLQLNPSGNFIEFGNSDVHNSNLFALHLDLIGDGNVLVEFRDQSEPDLPDFEETFSVKLSDFDKTVKRAFADENAVVPESTYKMAKVAISNMLGGIGYWAGSAKVKSKLWPTDKVEEYGPVELFSAVPSRPFFPRGFIWDEGFHNLLIHKVNSTLSLDIVTSWLNLMNSEGWIPREVILGREAESKVPSEFLVQSSDVANPPVFFYLLEKFAKNQMVGLETVAHGMLQLMTKHRTHILSMYPRLKQWYLWFRNSQQGPYKGVFQWQGRNSTTIFELNPKTLPSGLDDYPRATHPSPDEYHLDIRCWLAVSSRVIRYLAELASDNEFISEADDDQRTFNNLDHLDKYHWSETEKRYADFGLHSKKVKLETVHVPERDPVVVRKVMDPPKKRLADDIYGYVTIFPFLLKLLPTNSEKLGQILSELDNPDLLWSPYGLRSVAKSCAYYNQRNSKDDPPYWRGAIWINMNYLALDALQHYATQGSPHSERASSLYGKLKLNIVNNVQKEFERTGLFWENYDDKTGKGQGTRPFTGWTALIFAIVADNFE